MAYQLDTVKILIVDDMRPMLTLSKAILKALGFKHVYTAENGDDAFDALVKHDPDLVITDWVMGNGDGLEFTERIRRDKRAPDPFVPVIMMTGFSSRMRVETARDAGVTEFLMKPFTARDMYTRIKQIVEKPRQFVDNGEFIGPDRRRKRYPDYGGPRRREEEKIPGGPRDLVEIDILMRLQDEVSRV